MFNRNCVTCSERPALHPLPPLQSRSVTVVIPALNEEGNLDRLLLTLEQTFQDLGFTLPVLLVDDGSVDNSPELLACLIEQYPYLKVIRHLQHQGVTGVWKTALTDVTTDWIFWGQADLESDFRTDLPLLLEACVPGVDAVAGWRQKRGDGKVLASAIANLACRLMFGLKIHDMNWIKLVRRDLLSNLPVERITHRYLLAVLSAQGYYVTEISTPWHPRYSGKSKFGKGRLISSAIDFVKLWQWFYTEGHLINRAYTGDTVAQSNNFAVNTKKLKKSLNRATRTLFLSRSRKSTKLPISSDG